MITDAVQHIDFCVDEVLKLKGSYFKVVLVDSFTGKIGLKQISPQEARHLEDEQSKK